MLARRLLAPLFFLCAFALYLRTLAPSVAALFDDSLEFQLVGYRLAIAHPTGYPLYTLLLKASSYLPLGDVAYRANLLSALCAALAVALVYRLVLRLSGSALAGAVAAGALAVSPVFWSQAVVAEVYALNALLVAALLLAALPAHPDDPFPAHPARTAFWLGLGLTHHRTIALLALALAIAWIGGARPWRGGDFRGMTLLRQSLVPMAVFACPLLLYLYLPLRGDAGSLDGTYVNTLEGFLRWISAADYAAFLRDNPFETHYDMAFWANLVMAQFGWLDLPLCGAGIALWVRGAARRDAARIGLLAAFVVYSVFVLTYRVPDVQVFAIPVFLLMALALGEAIGALGARLARAHRAYPYGLAALAAVSLLPVYQTAQAQNDLSAHVAVRDYGRDIMAQRLPDNSAVVGILGEMTLIRYFQATEGGQPYLTIAADRDAERLAAIERELAAGRAVFTTRPLSGLAERYALGAAGPLVRVWRTPPPNDLPADAPRAGGVRYRLSGVQALTPRIARAQLAWVPDAPLNADLKVSARLLDGERVVAQQDSVPVRNAYPTRLWRAGARVDDAYDVALPPEAPGGTYRVVLILYRAETGAEVERINAGEIILGKP